jgi:hypothetical protein
MARYEAEAYQYYWEHAGQFQQENLQHEVKAPEFEVVEEPMNFGGNIYIIFGIVILTLMYFVMDYKGMFG